MRVILEDSGQYPEKVIPGGMLLRLSFPSYHNALFWAHLKILRSRDQG